MPCFFRAFFLWNLPGLIILTACGVLLAEFIPDPDNPPFWLTGLGPAAISLVFKAAFAFAKSLDSLGVCLSLFSCLVAILINNDDRIPPNVSQWVFPTILAIGGLITFVGMLQPFSLLILYCARHLTFLFYQKITNAQIHGVNMEVHLVDGIVNLMKL